ncbi:MULTISPECIES: sulfurtransferase complex subunit TusB [Halomonas]|uniref:sulfurtransferase complex subunit TusB n=1 Tax=Halomonas TaxID=2745 RepID=UPI0015520633|nr:sulfurtransferase complex subunit TusB [Halomonas hibernica]
MLHILTKALNSDAAQQMQQAIGEEDVVVLTEEGVQAALKTHWEGWQAYQSRIFLLAEDVAAWGLNAAVTANGLPMVDMNGFVTLTEHHPQIVTWY